MELTLTEKDSRPLPGTNYNAGMAIRVEFYGIARQRTGVAQIELEAVGGKRRLSDVLNELVEQFPALAEDCIAGDCLQKTLLANLDGQKFVTDPTTIIRKGQCLLILSADAGG